MTTDNTSIPDPRVVAWMRDFMRRHPYADRAMINVGAQEAYGERARAGHASLPQTSRPVTRPLATGALASNRQG